MGASNFAHILLDIESYLLLLSLCGLVLPSGARFLFRFFVSLVLLIMAEF